MNMNMFREYWSADKKRNCGYSKSFLYWFRKCQFGARFLRPLYKLIFNFVRNGHGIEIPVGLKVGKGLYIGHPYNITINEKTTIGENCNIHKGATIGRENRGKRKGVPTIGNEVQIGVNATIVGKVLIGDDVLIAPDAFVNCDIPSHCVVFGNLCTIKHKDNATEGYINNLT